MDIQTINWLINKESSSILNIDSTNMISSETVISQIFDSFAFISLLEKIQLSLGIEIAEDDFYEEDIITIGDLSKFLLEQKKNR